jgi:aminoglycoside 6'-N-acetyltransferase
METAPYAFRHVAASDLSLLRRWLSEPHVREWWGDPERAQTNIKEHLDDPSIDVFIVKYRDKPLGYIQSWNPHAEENHPCRDQPPGTRGIDQFIGEPELVNRGHGSAFIRTFVADLFEAGASRVITDPNPRNARALKAYEKAGFRPLGYRMTISGEALLMSCDAGKL